MTHPLIWVGKFAQWVTKEELENCFNTWVGPWFDAELAYRVQNCDNCDACAVRCANAARSTWEWLKKEVFQTPTLRLASHKLLRTNGKPRKMWTLRQAKNHCQKNHTRAKQ